MSKYKTSILASSETDALREFMRTNWSESHLLANDRRFMDRFYFDERNERYNIIIAKESEKIVGFITFIPTSFFDKNIAPENDFVWIANWLVSTQAEGGVGIMLYMALKALTKRGGYGTTGQNETAEGIYRKMKYSVGKLSQYYIINPNVRERKIIAVPLERLDNNDKEGSETAGDSEFYACKAAAKGDAGHFCDLPSGGGFAEIDENGLKSIEKKSESSPYKTADFIINKYLKSPDYKYFAYGVCGGGEAIGAIIFKVTAHNGAKCIRIVEYFGDSSALENKNAEFLALLNEFDAEYLDFYCHGISEDILLGSGFSINTGDIIIPNYFEPFVNANIEIGYAYDFKDKRADFTVYKGDCDREQPRL